METPEEFTGSNDHTLIIRGKRTKRPRAAAAAVTSSLSSGGGSYDVGDDFYFSILSSTPKSSSGETSRTSTEEEEDEDLANCLILLAQGVVPKIEKISARRFADISSTTTTTGGKASFYVYECKTCNRTFSSFQALGGHRASHKKPKTAAAEEGEEQQFTKISPPLPLPLPLHHFPTTTRAPQQILHNIAKASKVHECSICGAEFSSGQALGGHMRRHRAAPNSRIAAISGEESHRDDDDEEEEEDEKRRKILPLDLNLPAPMEDYEHHHHHQRDAKFLDYTVTNKQRLVFSGPALVDCHY